MLQNYAQKLPEKQHDLNVLFTIVVFTRKVRSVFRVTVRNKY